MTRQNNIKNSSGKITGKIIFDSNKIMIDNQGKPILIIDDVRIINALKDNHFNKEIILELYYNYTLTVGEIAGLYNRCYSNINKYLRNDCGIKVDKQGRRNSSYGKVFSEERRKHIGEKSKGRKIPQYTRTPAIRNQISNSLKQYYKNHPQDATPHINNWKNGKYDNIDFHIGIGGSFYSIKNKHRIRFRSLLELYYMLMLESDIDIQHYEYEAIRIPMDNGSYYTPDIKIDNNLIELKSKKYVERVDGVKDKVLYKQEQALKYCKENSMTYQIIYDEDIGFISRNFKKFINNNNEELKKYKIVFNDKNRMVLK